MVSSSLVKTDRILSKERGSSPDIKFKEGILQIVDRGQETEKRRIKPVDRFTKTEMLRTRYTSSYLRMQCD